jgi:phage terminase small subunit
MVRAHNPPRQEIALRDYEVGPDMLALTDRQRAFVFHLVDQGGLDHHRAASKAGYKGDTETLRVTGWRLAHDERIGLAMIEEARRRLHATAILAASELHKILEDPTTSKMLKLRGIQMVLNRTGLGSSQTHVVKHEVTVTDEQKIADIQAMAEKLGLDPTKLLGSYGITIEGTAEPALTNGQSAVAGLTSGRELTIVPDDEPDEGLEEEETW